ncbi:DUF6786 family protein [Segetibacter sp. 3557_3]|uniref:DUF6786 family protein n=1 Tax=Segetibacter sp. 3557_3 TaxID=2547429 RepID=UPI001FB78ADE|nr:DUF6786 family protein [Segetibacter sp. 3557_3]
MSNPFFPFAFLCIMSAACNNQPKPVAAKQLMKTAEQGSFQYDLDFLNSHDQVIVLGAPGEPAQVIVSARYQGKVFTSTADGPGGKSFGWINYKAFSGAEDSHMNAYGGENRFWLGPEGGRYSLYFGKGKKNGIRQLENPGANRYGSLEDCSKERTVGTA